MAALLPESAISVPHGEPHANLIRFLSETAVPLSTKGNPSCEEWYNFRKLTVANAPVRHQDINITSGESQLRVLHESLQDTMVFGQKPSAAPQVPFSFESHG